MASRDPGAATFPASRFAPAIFTRTLLVVGLGSLLVALALSVPQTRELLVRLMAFAFGGRGDLTARMLWGLQLHTVLFGALLALTACFLEYSFRRHGQAPVPMERALLHASVFFVGAYWLVLALATHTGVIGDVRYWWLSDDQMIAMRYARNLVEGNGLVWNPGLYIEGFSNPLWTFFMVAAHWLLPLPEHQISLVILLTNIVLILASLPFLFRLVDQLGGGLTAKYIAAALYAVSAHLLYLTITGWEQSLLALLTVVCLSRTFDEIRSGNPTWATCLLLGVIALVRIDAALISGLLGSALLLYSTGRVRTMFRLAVAVLLPLSYEVFRVSYYGELVPNTYYLKLVGWDRLRFGKDVIKSFLLEFAVALSLVSAGFLVVTRRREYAIGFALVALLATYSWWTGGGWGPDSRKHLSPALGVLFVLAAVAIELIAQRRKNSAWVAAALAAAVFVGPKITVPGQETKFLLWLKDGEFENVRIGVALKQLDPGVLVSDGGAGQVFYFGGTLGHDYLGVNDKYIAQLSPVVQIAKAAHSKFDFDYSITRIKPDYILGTLPSHHPLDKPTIDKLSGGDWPFVGRLYQHPDFAKHCLPNPMQWDTPRIVYRCEWPDTADAPGQPAPQS